MRRKMNVQETMMIIVGARGDSVGSRNDRRGLVMTVFLPYRGFICLQFFFLYSDLP